EKLGFRAADMINQLLAFARKDMVEFRNIDLTPFINEAFKLSRVAVPDNIRCSCDIERQMLMSECDATQVQQMLMNLLANATDALQDTPDAQIELCLSRVTPDGNFYIRHAEASQTDYAVLSLEDNGCGMEAAQLEHIFEPFFTTKGVGEGSGLGLSMVFGTMQRHKGVIEVDSMPGRGSIFRLYFPLREKDNEPAETDKTMIWSNSGQRLLMADDEPIVLKTVSEMLRIDGFIVDTANDGRDALEQFIQHPEIYDAVILDVVMPRLGGVDTATRIREIRKDIPIIFATGYDREHVLSGVQGMSNVVALSKPLHALRLHQVLGEMLHNPIPEDA
ncbi:MAG: ATP-binding protein, partial [Mariprofundaceae bacterium]|nr:ATP-binding protein [Mariprofundaceae bacterium]